MFQRSGDHADGQGLVAQFPPSAWSVCEHFSPK